MDETELLTSSSAFREKNETRNVFNQLAHINKPLVKVVCSVVVFLTSFISQASCCTNKQVQNAKEKKTR